MINGMRDPSVHENHDRRVLLLKAVLLVIWALVSFGACFFARDLNVMMAGWPLNYWIASQGAVLVFIGIVAVYAAIMNRLDPEDEAKDA